MRNLRFGGLAACLAIVLFTSVAGTCAAAQYGASPQAQPRRGLTNPPPIPPASHETKKEKDYSYGVGYAAPWEPASGVHWRRDARLEYYARPPAPTWRWLTTGRGCCYDDGIKYGVGYPQAPFYGYGRR